MTRSKSLWGLVAILCAPAGIAIGKARLLAPTPLVFAILGVLAALCLGGIWYGIRSARRAAREGRPLGN